MCIKEKIYLAQFKYDKYLVLNTEKEKLLSYQLEMINNNRECGILEIEAKQFNSKLELNYKVVNLESLEEYIINTEMDERKLINIIKSISNIVNSYENYFLDQDNYLLEIDRIYINPINNVIKMVYIPLEENVNEDFEKEFKKLIKELVTTTMNKNWVDTNKLGVSTLEYLENNNFNIVNFEKFILSFQKSDTTTMNYNSQIKNKNLEKNNQNKYKIVENKTVADNHLKSEKKEQRNVFESKKTKKSLEVSKIVFVISTLFLIIGIYVSITSNELSTMIKLFIGIGSLLSIVVLIMLFIKKNNNKEKNTEEKFRFNENQIKFNNFNENDYCTEILEEEKSFYLIKKDDKFAEKIKITNNDFIIGRLKDEVDFCIPIKTVGKTHAKIVKEKNENYLIDINSKNGTYLNGKRLDANKAYQLTDNDEIIFVNNKYIYKEI
ncbi:MAG: DUF6382 domain-containing protein [Clostridium sp.]|uniref:DUF6382 domain-containing protein n=1 Tax=Clostridium sp. TaxID=1506 RepID=UPI003EE756BD